jgi:uncharacterized protein (TIGR00299 family) protein
MKIAYFDCFAGASGDMVLGALLDAGLEIEKLRAVLGTLGLDKCGVHAEKVLKKGLSGTQARVAYDQEHHGHHHRHLAHIVDIIRSSQLDPVVKDRSVAVFTRLAEAEAAVHNSDVESVHFHEVGAVDAIIDVVGAVSGLHLLGIEACYCSPIHVGFGTVTCAHGVLPVPAPATARLMQGKPIYSTGVTGELLTPTGAAILTTLCESFGPMPPMCIEQAGYGAGESDPEIPNLLRVSIGTTADEEAGLASDQVAVVETNVDDMSPQIYEHVMEKALEMGARDVFLSPIQMKKNRPGTLITIICGPGDVGRAANLLMTETTSIGIRWRLENRLKAKREIRSIETPWGRIHVKDAKIGHRIVNTSPEYDDCKKVANQYGVSLKTVMEKVRKLAWLDGEAKAEN